MRQTRRRSASASPEARRMYEQEKMFTMDAVRRALPYVRRILSDAFDAYATAQRARRRLNVCPRGFGHARLAEQRDNAVARLNRAIDEFMALGVAHLDIPKGRVAFRVEIEGRLASVLWRLEDALDDPEAEKDAA